MMLADRMIRFAPEFDLGSTQIRPASAGSGTPPVPTSACPRSLLAARGASTPRDRGLRAASARIDLGENFCAPKNLSHGAPSPG